MDTQFDEEAEAAAWLSKRIAEAIDEAVRAGQEAEAFTGDSMALLIPGASSLRRPSI